MKYCLFLICFCFCFFLSAKTVEKTLVTVEGEMISFLDLQEARQRLKQGFLESSVLLPLFNQAQLQKKDSVLLEFLIYEKLLDISITDNSPQVEEGHLKQELNNNRKKSGLSKRSFSRLLVKNHFTSSSYKEFLKKSVLRKLFVQKEIIEKIRISDQDLNEYALQKQGKALFTSFEYELAYLSFPLTETGKQQAQKTFQTISKDSLFFDEWKPNGAEEKKEVLKKLNLSAFHPSIKMEIQKLSTGQISPVLSLPSGYHIFKVLWKTPVISAKNKKRKQKISTFLFKKLFREKLKSWLEEKKKKSFIQINS